MAAALRTEADLIRTLRSGTYTLPDLYALAEEHGLADRPGGRADAGDGQARYKRRVRSALYAQQRAGRVHRVDNEPAWLIEGTPAAPRRALFVWLPRDPSQIELVLGAAANVLARAGEPVDLVLADPPWALGRGDNATGYQRTYGRDRTAVVPGYVDVDPGEYAEFTAEWVAAAGAALRPGGYLAVVTGPQQAARMQVAVEDVAGLTYVNSIAVERRFGLYCTRRLTHQHYVALLATKGPLAAAARTWNVPAETVRGRNGGRYAVDVWSDVPEANRAGLLRYDNALHPALPSRLMRMTTNPGDLVCDPFLGGGSTAVACLRTGRRFYGGDVNPSSLSYVMGLILAEVVPAMRVLEQTPTLFAMDAD